MKVRDIIQGRGIGRLADWKSHCDRPPQVFALTKPGKVRVGPVWERRSDRHAQGDNKANGSEAMKYAVIFEQGPSSVGVTVPDLPGCFAVAPNLAEARTLIAEAISF